MALRELSGKHAGTGWDIWISAMKAVPTFVAALFLVVRKRVKDEPIYQSGRGVRVLFAAAVVMQFGGNLGFQMALGHIGLAISVPLVFAFIICSGALLGKIVLGDNVTPRTAASVGIMMAAIIFLSYAATLTADNADGSRTAQSGTALLGVLIAVISGTSYGVNGVVIRRAGQKAMSVGEVLLIYSLVGVIALTIPGWWMMGTDGLANITLYEWHMMFWAGTFNAIGFFAVTYALKLANITLVNVINASQNAICAVAAVLIFAEPQTIPLVIGVLLSMAGLIVLDRK